jgi:HEAT repeat protein
MVLELAGALLLLGAQSSAAPTPESRIERVLAESRSGSDIPILEQAARLSELGPNAIPVLFDLLRAEPLPPFLAPARAFSPVGIEALDPRQSRVVVAALQKFRRPQLVGPLTEILLGTTRVPPRANALRILGAVGDGRDLPLLCRSIAPISTNGDVDPALAQPFREAAAEILRRDLTALFGVQSLLRDLPAASRLCMIRALADLATAPALAILSQRLGAVPLEDAILLNEIARAASSVPLPVEPAVLEALRPHLRSENPILARAAARCVGGLEDVASIADLIELLAHPDGGVRDVAHAALCRIGGVSFPPDGPRWRAWRDGETQWFEKTAPRSIEDFLTGADLDKSRAIAELSQHPLFRAEIAAVLQRSLPDASAPIRLLGLGALRQLGAATAIPFLETCAEDPDPAVAAEAKAALERIRKLRAPAGATPRVTG